MNTKTRRILLSVAVILLLAGLTLAIPSFLARTYLWLGISALLAVSGVILFAATYGG